eukprot:jgi/Galph1/927/GphlegSOOS_G5731.1
MHTSRVEEFCFVRSPLFLSVRHVHIIKKKVRNQNSKVFTNCLVSQKTLCGSFSFRQLFVLSTIVFSLASFPSVGFCEHLSLKGRVTVIDGDTIRFQHGPRIRLSDIDAPELKQTCTKANGLLYHCGENSKQTLQSILSNKKVSCEADKQDIYGRWLGTCWIIQRDGKVININEKMIELGEAVVYRNSVTYRKEEQTAKRLKRGMDSNST